MRIWRISNHETLDGLGGLRVSARWHTRGHRVVYCAPNPATALLEVLVHAEVDVQHLPLSYKFLEIEVPEDVKQDTVDRRRLSRDWASSPEDTQRIGDEWLSSSASAILLVPCVIVPETLNVLVNPMHPDARRISIHRAHPHPFDERLLRA